MKQLFIQILSLLLVLANGYIVPDPVMPVNTNYLGSYNEYNDLKVQTDSGIVQGEIKPNQFRPNFQVRQFIGIPYAQKPIDIYRFSVSGIWLFYWICWRVLFELLEISGDFRTFQLLNTFEHFGPAHMAIHSA